MLTVVFWGFVVKENYAHECTFKSSMTKHLVRYYIVLSSSLILW